LAHPNIVRVYEIGTVGDMHYFTMDCIEGTDFEGWLQAHPGRIREAVEILARAAEALDYAHRHGVVHRDIKPGNLLIATDGEPFLADLGLGRALDAGSTATAAGTVLGTPAYMPPEQAAGNVRDVDAQSDIYSLGAVLYHVLTGKPPFSADSIGGVLRSVIENDPRPPRLVNPAVPLDLELVCLKCLEKEKDRRYPSAAELARDLRRFLASEPVEARAATLAYRLQRWIARHRALAVTFALFLLFFIAMAIRTLGPSRLRVRTAPPDARVTIDGEPLADGWLWPFAGAGWITAERAYLMRIEAEGYETQELRVHLASFIQRDYGTIALVPAHGLLSIDSDPAGAEVLLDGRPIGARTPARELRAPTGVHDLELRLDGRRPWRTVVRVVGGESLDLERVELGR